MSSSKGLLIAAPERWDEACFAVPAIRALLRSGLPGGIVCREEQSDFWKTVSDLPQIHFSRKTTPAALASEIGGSWEASLTWEPGIPAKAFAKAGITRRLGPGSPAFKKLLTHPMEVAERAFEHRVRLYINTAVQMGISVDKPEYFVSAPIGIPAEPNTVLLSPDSDFGTSHEWPLGCWQELAEALMEQGKRITVAGVVGGRGLGKVLASRLGNDSAFFHASPLAASLPLLAVHQLVIAADGSLPHLAAHAGSTCVTLFGPNDANWKRPLGKRHAIVKRHVECAPCLSPKCLLDSRCQNELEVSRVLAAIPKSF
ncbi:MAG: glycosyltransferase family 9 protein [Luteolibacter sp.]